MSVTTVVDLPLRQAFELSMSWSRQGEWIPLTDVRVIEGDGRAVGSRIEAYTGIGRLGGRPTRPVRHSP